MVNYEIFLSHLPPGMVTYIGQKLAKPLPLRPYPGWYFGLAEEEGKTITRLRLAVWKYYQHKRIKDPLEVTWHHGIRLQMHLGNDTSRLLYVAGCFEPNEFWFLNRTLQPGMVFVDVGANEGLYTLFSAKRVGSQGKVLAIEPSKREFRRLESNIAMNQLRNIRTFRCALYSEEKMGQLAIAESEHAGQNTVGKTISNPKVRRESLEDVEMQTLDGLFEKQGINRLDFVKIDVEGAEMQVLIGGQKNIRHYFPLLQLEISDSALRLQNSTRKALSELLQSWGYVLYVFDSDGRLRQPDSPDELEGNVIAAPAGRVLN